MRLKVLYCGGCNPRYDRASVVSKIKSSFEGISIVDKDYDLLVVLAGCNSVCVNHSDYLTPSKVIIKKEEDIDLLIQSINRMLGEEGRL